MPMLQPGQRMCGWRHGYCASRYQDFPGADLVAAEVLFDTFFCVRLLTTLFLFFLPLQYLAVGATCERCWLLGLVDGSCRTIVGGENANGTRRSGCLSWYWAEGKNIACLCCFDWIRVETGLAPGALKGVVWFVLSSTTHLFYSSILFNQLALLLLTALVEMLFTCRARGGATRIGRGVGNKVNIIYFTMFYYFIHLSNIFSPPCHQQCSESPSLIAENMLCAGRSQQEGNIMAGGGSSKVNICHNLLVCMCCYFIDINLMPPPQSPPGHHKLMETVGWGCGARVDWGYSGGIIWMG